MADLTSLGRMKADDLRDALAGARDQIVTDARDWGENATDSRLYAVLVGWDDAMDEQAARHGWDPDYVRTLRRRRAAVARLLSEPGWPRGPEAAVPTAKATETVTIHVDPCPSCGSRDLSHRRDLCGPRVIYVPVPGRR